MSEEIALAVADLATVEQLHARIHTLNNQLAVAQFGHEILLDDVRRAIAQLPQEPGAALGVLTQALISETGREVRHV